jgi:hypothetical protein
VLLSPVRPARAPPRITQPDLAVAGPCSSPARLLPRSRGRCPPVLLPGLPARPSAHACLPPTTRKIIYRNTCYRNTAPSPIGSSSSVPRLVTCLLRALTLTPRPTTHLLYALTLTPQPAPSSSGSDAGGRSSSTPRRRPAGELLSLLIFYKIIAECIENCT